MTLNSNLLKKGFIPQRYAYVGAVYDGSAFDDDSDMAAAKVQVIL